MLQSHFSRLTDHSASFLRDETGSISIEAVIILPVLVLFYLVSFTFYDAYRKQTVITKAAYTVADLISRQSNTVSAFDVEGLGQIFRYLTRGRQESYVRVSRVTRFVDVPAGIDEYRVDASYATNGESPMTALELDTNLARVPVLSPNTSVTVLETYTPYVPPFFIGLDAYTMESFVTTPQRSGLPIALDDTPLPNGTVLPWSTPGGGGPFGNGAGINTSSLASP